MRKSQIKRVLIEVYDKGARLRLLKQATNSHGRTRTLEQDAACAGGRSETEGHIPCRLIAEKGRFA